MNIYLNSRGSTTNTPSFINNNFSDRELSLVCFQRILNFISNEMDFLTNFSGGEPFLHSDFRKITQKLMMTPEVRCISFNTHGRNLDLYLKELITLSRSKDYLSLCLYYNSSNRQDLMIDLLRKLSEEGLDLIIGVEILDKTIQDFKEIIEFAAKARIKTARWEITFPDESSNKDRFLNNAKHNLLNFVKSCSDNGINLFTTCNNIPYCYFSVEELRLLSYSSNNNLDGVKCYDQISFYPDETVSACRATGSIERRPLDEFSDYSSLKEFSNEQLDTVRKTKLLSECKTCESYLFSKDFCGCIMLK